MATTRALIAVNCWTFEGEGGIDGLVTVDGEFVEISPHGADRDVGVAFSRDEWKEIVKLVESVPEPIKAMTEMSKEAR